MRAIETICKQMKHQQLQSKVFNYCGIKDQRGVTAQLIQAPGYVYPEALTYNLPANIRLGNFSAD